MNITPTVWTLLIVSFYTITYSLYSKSSKAYSSELAFDLVLLRKGVKWSLKEFNKVLGLAGLTEILLGIGGYPRSLDSNTVMVHALFLILLHATLSLTLIYNLSMNALLDQWWLKQFSIMAGLVSWGSLLFYVFWHSEKTVLGFSAVTGILHFWTMEVDRSFTLHVRPAGYIPFLLAVLIVAFSD
jgi:hypothetical protein